jgi:multisubunit Na+/H+ antiporter MnhE subunit
MLYNILLTVASHAPSQSAVLGFIVGCIVTGLVFDYFTTEEAKKTKGVRHER